MTWRLWLNRRFLQPLGWVLVREVDTETGRNVRSYIKRWVPAEWKARAEDSPGLEMPSP